MMLNGVTGFMSRNTDGGDGRAVAGGIGEAQDLGARIVVVGQVSRGPLYAHTGQAILAEDAPGRALTGMAGAGADLTVFAEGAFDAGLSDQAEQESRYDEDQVPRIETVHKGVPADGHNVQETHA